MDCAFFLGLSGSLKHQDGGLWKEESNELSFSSLYVAVFSPRIQPVGFISSAVTHPRPPPLYILPDGYDFVIPYMGGRDQYSLKAVGVCEDTDATANKGDSEPRLR